MRGPAAFAIPGDISTRTGGFIYERRLLEGLRAQGRDVAHIPLPASFPDPSPGDMQAAVDALLRVPPERPLIIDGLVFGAIATPGLARVTAPIVAMIHHPLALESGLSSTRARHLFVTERDNLRLAAHVLVPSPHTKRMLVERYDARPERITVAPPGVDPPAGPPAPTSPPLILSVGILHPRKGHDVLLSALSRLVELEWRATIVGGAYDPACARSLHRQAAAACLSGRVEIAGEVDGSSLDMLYRQATLFTLATRYEGYGMVFAEALSHGLPIVATRVGAVPDTVPETAGLLVAPDEPADLAQAIKTVLTDAPLRNRLRTASAGFGASLGSWGETARHAGAVLDTLAARRG